MIAGGGGPTWNRALFKRQVPREAYRAAVAANDTLLSPSGAPATDSIIGGETMVAPRRPSS